jgi:hypothetical protein
LWQQKASVETLLTCSKAIICFQEYLGARLCYTGDKLILFQTQGLACKRWMRFLKRKTGKTKQVLADHEIRCHELHTNSQTHPPTNINVVNDFMCPDANSIPSDDVNLDNQSDQRPDSIVVPTHALLQQLCRDEIARIKDIQTPSLAVYNTVLATVLTSMQVLQRTWRFNAYCRLSMVDVATAFAHPHHLWVDTLTKGHAKGEILAHAFTDEVMEICRLYAQKWRSLVSKKTDDTDAFLLLQTGNSIKSSTFRSRAILEPFLAQSGWSLSNTQIRHIQETEAAITLPSSELPDFVLNGGHGLLVGKRFYQMTTSADKAIRARNIFLQHFN